MNEQEKIWQALEDVKDPELPMISVVEMGIVREVIVDVQDTAVVQDTAIAQDTAVTIKMTPTFSGCPALDTMRNDIQAKLHEIGYANTTVETIFSPPWSSDWITDSAREKLRNLGIAPPQKHHGQVTAVAFLDVAQCPRCSSKNSTLKNAFGPTLCKSLWYCHDCQDAFEQFKVL